MNEGNVDKKKTLSFSFNSIATVTGSSWKMFTLNICGGFKCVWLQVGGAGPTTPSTGNTTPTRFSQLNHQHEPTVGENKQFFEKEKKLNLKCIKSLSGVEVDFRDIPSKTCAARGLRKLKTQV